MKALIRAGALLLSLVLTSCTPPGAGPLVDETAVGTCDRLYANLGYRPPFLPVTFTIGLDGTISVGVSPQIVTPIGTFSVEAGVSNSLDAEPASTALIVRHRKDGRLVDDAFRICEDKVVISLNGETIVEVSNGHVFVDASNGDVRSIDVREKLDAVPPSSPPPSATTTEQHIAAIDMLGNMSNGVQFTLPNMAGLYRFKYVSGAYSIYAIGAEPPGVKTWLTSVFIFRGDQVPYDDEILRKSQAVLALADIPYSATKEDAVQKASQDHDGLKVRFSAGEVISLVGVDHRSYFSENPGEVIVNVTYVGV